MVLGVGLLLESKSAAIIMGIVYYTLWICKMGRTLIFEPRQPLQCKHANLEDEDVPKTAPNQEIKG